METLTVMDSGVQVALADESLEGTTAKRMKKEPGITGKSVVVLKGRDVVVRSGIAFMPNTIEMAQLKKRGKGQFKTNVQFCSKMTEADVKRLLMNTFPYLENQRFYCAASANNRTRLDFHGQPRIWDGQFIKRKIKGNSALYILTYEQEIGDGLDSKVPEQMTLKRSHDQITSPENEMFEQSLKTGTKRANTLNVLTGFEVAVSGSSILTGALAEGSQPKPPEKMSQMVPCIYVPVTGQYGLSSMLYPSISATHDTKKGNDIAVSLAPLSQSIPLDSAMQSGAIPKARISMASNQQSLSRTADGSSNTWQAGLPLAVHRMPQEIHSVFTPDMNKLHISSRSTGQLQKTVNVEKTVLTRDQRAWTTEGRGSSVRLPVTTTTQGDKSFELVKGAGTGFQQGARIVWSDRLSHATDDQPDSGFSDAEEKGASWNSAAEAAVLSDSGLENTGAPSKNPNTCIQDQNYSSKDLILDWIETPLGTFPDEDFALYLNTDLQEESEPINVTMNESSFLNSGQNDQIPQIATDPRPCQIPAGAVITGAENGISSKGVVQNPRIYPKSSDMEGGEEFLIAFPEPLAQEVTSGVAFFKGVGFAPLRKYRQCDLEGIVPRSTKPGIVDVKVFDQSGNCLGITTFCYRRPTPWMEVAVRDENLPMLFSVLEQKFKHLQVSAGDNNAAQGLGPLNIHYQGQTQQQQSLQRLQLPVYTAAETGAQEFIEIIYSTSAGRTVFYSYKDKTPLPEDVARANGHTYLTQYLQDVNTRLSKEVGSEAQSNAIDWLELVKAVQTEASGAQVKSVKEEKHPSESGDNSSDYFADSETSSNGSLGLDEANHPDSYSDSSIDKEGDGKKPTSFGLPLKIPNFIGRSEDCDKITSMLTSDDVYSSRVVTIVGPPGFGKTALAIMTAYKLLDLGKDVLHVSLRNVATMTHAAEKLLEISDIPVGQKPILRVTQYLVSCWRPTVLILDNAEDLQYENNSAFNGFLQEINEKATNLVTLVTSRITLNHNFFLTNFPLRPLTEEQSILFLKNHAPSMTDQEARRFSWHRVCGGVPLFLKVTASFLQSQTIDPVELHRNLQNSSHKFHEAKKQQDVFNLLRPFYNHLQPDQQQALTYLAAFPTVFTKEEAVSVLFCDRDPLEFQILLDVLKSHSLVQQDEVNGSVHYSLHPLVQAFCVASSEETGYRMAIKQFSQHYLSLLQQLNDDFISADCKTAIDKYQMYKTNIHHALMATTEDDPLKHYGLYISTEAVNFLAKVMSMDEFMSCYVKFRDAAEALPDKRLYADCLVSLGFRQLCYYGYKDAHNTEANRNLQEAHDLQNHLGIHDTECHGHCKCKLGLCTFIAGDQKKGISLIAQGIAVRKKRLHSEGSGKMEHMLVAGGFSDLAMAMFNSGKYKAAVNIWEKCCLVRYRELMGTHPFTASVLHYIGDAYQKLHIPEEAVKSKKECLQMRRFLLGEEHLDTARAYYGLGCALADLGSLDEALENLSKAYRLQIRFHASKQDIDRTKQEIDRLQFLCPMAVFSA